MKWWHFMTWVKDFVMLIFQIWLKGIKFVDQFYKLRLKESMIFHIWFYITSKKVKDFPNLWVNDFPRSMIIMVFNSRTIRKGSMAWIKKSKKCILYKKYETREASHQKVSYHISRNRSCRYFFFGQPCHAAIAQGAQWPFGSY